MWLLEESVKSVIEELQKSPDLLFSEAHQDRLTSATEARDVLSITGNVAEININGILTNKPDLMSLLFGGGNTTYEEIVGAVKNVEADDSVESVVFRFGDTPGGNVLGLYTAMETISGMSKPSRAVIENQATSASYMLASQADSIIAANDATLVGSIGVATTRYVSDEVVEIASTDAPKKRPDLSTDKGKAVVREELDDFHNLFASAIASGRNVTVADVNKNFGQGAIVLAKQALKTGMIDGIGTASIPKNTAKTSGLTMEVSMDLNELKSKHPATYDAAVQEGVSQERDRVKGHLVFGEKSGDMKTAVGAVKDGSEMTSELMATYSSAITKRALIDAREKDNPDDVAPETPAAAGGELSEIESAVTAAVVSAFGGGGEVNV